MAKRRGHAQLALLVTMRHGNSWVRVVVMWWLGNDTSDPGSGLPVRGVDARRTELSGRTIRNQRQPVGVPEMIRGQVI